MNKLQVQATRRICSFYFSTSEHIEALPPARERLVRFFFYWAAAMGTDSVRSSRMAFTSSIV